MKLNRAAIWIVPALSAALPASALRLQRTWWPRPGSRLGTFSLRTRLPGMLIIGANLWVGEEAQGLGHYIPVDPNKFDPVNTGHC